MNILRALLVDDEPLALRRLMLTLGKLDDVEIVESTTSARQAVDLIEDLRPDIIFLDIAMPGLNGFDVIEKIPPDQQPAVIFATAFGNHAVKAFGVDAVDYLLKPIAPDRLRQSVDRARMWLVARNTSPRSALEPEQPSSGVAAASIEDSLWAHRHQGFVRIPIDQIIWIEAEGDYVRVHAKQGSGLMRKTLTALDAELDAGTFIRVHRSAICRRSEITELQRRPTGALRVALSNGDWAPVGRSYGRSLRVLLEQMRTGSTSSSEEMPASTHESICGPTGMNTADN